MLRLGIAALLLGTGWASAATTADPANPPHDVFVVRGNLTVQQILEDGAALRGDGTFRAEGAVDFANATGTLSVNGATLTLKSHRLSFGGANLSLQVSASNIIPPTDGVPRVELPTVRIDGTAASVDVDGVQFGSRAVSARASALRVPAAWAASGSVGIVGLAAALFVGLRHRPRDRMGVDAWVRGDTQKALARAEQRLAKRPHDRDATVLRGAALFRLGRVDDAMRFLEAQRSHVQDDGGLLAILASAGLWNAGREAEARRELQRAIRASPRLAEQVSSTELAALLEEPPHDAKGGDADGSAGYA